MNVLTSVGILILAALILASMQLAPGIFAIFMHYVHGKFSHKKAANLSTFFIIGAETSAVIIFLCIYAILCSSPAIAFVIDSNVFAWIMAGIFLALTFATLGLYYRRGAGTRLFIPRRFSQGLKSRISSAKSRSDAFVLGFVSLVPELIFTLPLYLIVTITIMRLDTICPARAGLIILFAIIAISPLLIMRIMHATGFNLADFIRFRFKNKSFFRFCIALCFLLIASLIILGVTR